MEHLNPWTKSKTIPVADKSKNTIDNNSVSLLLRPIPFTTSPLYQPQ